MKWFKVVVFIIVIVTIFVSIRNYQEAKYQDYALYTVSALNEVERHFVQESLQTTPSLPTALPSVIEPYAVGEKIVLADPFNTHDTGNKLLEAHGETRDASFSYKGNPLSYKRLEESNGVIYSLGVDRDDDTRVLSDKILQNWVQGQIATKEILNITYDPTNGLISNGDIIKPVNLNKSLRKERFGLTESSVTKNP